MEISFLTARDVLCTDTMQLVRPGMRPLDWTGVGDVHRRAPLAKSARAMLPPRVRAALWRGARAIGRR